MGLISILGSDPVVFILIVISLVFALCIHEFSHGYIAYLNGDDTAYRMGRLTLNPLKHLDPIGSMMILFIGFGYAKPVPVNPNNLDNPRKDIIKVDPRYFRPTEVETLLGDATKAKKKLKWVPKISFNQLVKEMIEKDLNLAKNNQLTNGN